MCYRVINCIKKNKPQIINCNLLDLKKEEKNEQKFEGKSKIKKKSYLTINFQGDFNLRKHF